VPYEEVCLKRHILLMNWNHKGYEVIENLHSDDVQDPRQIVIVTDKPVSLDPSRPENRGVVVVPGDPCDENVLRMANAERASNAILLSDGDSESTSRSLMMALAIRAVSSDVYVVVEVADDAEKCHFEALGNCVDEIVCPSEYVSRILAQGAVYPDSGVVELYTHLLGQSPNTNEIYLVPMPEVAIGGSFVERFSAIREAADQTVIPIGYTSQADGMRFVAIGPGSGGRHEKERVLQAGDQLVLISMSWPQFSPESGVAT